MAAMESSVFGAQVDSSLSQLTYVLVHYLAHKLHINAAWILSTVLLD